MDCSRFLSGFDIIVPSEDEMSNNRPTEALFNSTFAHMRITLSILSFFLFLSAFAQNTDEELAAQYFAEGEFDKAVILYKELHKDDPSSMYIYQNYIDCLIKLKDLREAEKVVSKAARKNKEFPAYSVDLGEIYKLQGEEKKRKELYDELIDELEPDWNSIEQLSNAFLKYNLLDRAEASIMHGRKLIGNPIEFHTTLVSIYRADKADRKLIDECMHFLRFDPSSVDQVKNEVIAILDKESSLNYIQDQCIENAQKFSNNNSFDQLLLWVFIQQKKFSSAFRHVVAIDKRQRGDGQQVFDLARICMKNREYAIAERCYENLIERGQAGNFYLPARMGMLESSYQKTMAIPDPSDEALQSLVASYNGFLDEFGKNWKTAESIKELADIYIFQIHDMNAGIALLKELVTMPRVRRALSANYKLALADAHVIEGDVWEATLLYGQVDKEFKEDPLGQEAKFRNARLSYFRGDFEWAKDQLDVLKTATSQLISNNAIELALLIQDNTGLDSTTDALEEYANAQLLFFQNKLDACLEALNLIPFKYPNHSLEDEIYMTKARVMVRKKDFIKAETFYLSVIDLFPEDILADNALYELGKLYEEKLLQPNKAVEMYEKLIFDHSGSLFVVDARKRYTRLKEEVNTELN